MAKSVLLMTKDSEKKEAIAGVCKSVGVELKEIRPGNINSPIGGFIGMPLNATAAKEAPEGYEAPELILFCELKKEDIDTFVGKYNEAGIEPIALKAAISANNITWSPYEFIVACEKELK